MMKARLSLCPALVVAALLTFSAAGCTPAAPAGPIDPTPTVRPTAGPPSSAAPSSSDPPTPDQKADMRTRLADALRPQDPISAGLVVERTTTLKVLGTDWLPGWQVIDVTARRMPHPRRFFVGLSSDGQAQYLSGHPEAFGAMVQSARIRVGSATTAVEETQTFLDSTRAFERYSYRVDDVSAIEWRTDLSSDEQAARTKVEQAWASKVRPPRASPAGGGWTLEAWMVDGDTLVRHDLEVSAAGAVNDRSEVVVGGLPVPYTT